MNDRTYFRRILLERSRNENVSHHSDSMRYAYRHKGSASSSLHNRIIFKINKKFLCLCLCVHVYMPYVYVCLWRLEEDVRSLRVGVIGTCELDMGAGD